MVGRDTLRGDLIAGLTGAAVVLPQGVAFATIAGLPPQYGLYAAMVPAVIAALWGSSWHLVSGPTTAISIVVFSMISPLAEPGSPEFVTLVLTLTFLAGVFELIMGLARMGTLVNFISHTVVIGFTAGAAILIASSQIKNFFGLSIPRGASFYTTMHTFITHIPQINLFVTAVAVITLVAGIVAKKYLVKFPYMVVAMVVGSLAALGLNEWVGGVGATGIKTVGVLPAGLPPLSHPILSLEMFRLLASSAFAVSLLALTEAVSISRAIAVNSEQRVNGNQEFVGQGISNIVGSFFSGYASSGSFNRSGLNYVSGAKTPLSAVFAAVFLLIILLFVAPLAAYLPIAAMAGILFLVAYGLIDFKHIKSIIKTSRAETVVLTTTFLATLFVELEFAIYIGVILSLVLYLRKTAYPEVSALVPDHTHLHRRLIPRQEGMSECPQMKIIKIDGSAFFGAVNHLEKELHDIADHHPSQKHLLITGESMAFLDIAAAEMFAQEARRRRKIGGGLYFYALPREAERLLHKGEYIKEIGEENIFHSKVEAIRAIHARTGTGHCGHKEGSVFAECEGKKYEHIVSPFTAGPNQSTISTV